MRLCADSLKSVPAIRMLGVLVLCGVILAMPTSVKADSILTLNPEPPQTVGPQSDSAPCIIAGTHCQNPSDFGYTNFIQAGNITAFDENSPVYSISDFPFLTFNVAIDVNTTREEGEILDLFEVYLGDVATGTRIYNYEGPGAIGLLASNGNGFGDWTLRNIDLSSYDPNQTIQFRARWHGASDGAESFFIVSTDSPSEVPEPTSLLLLSTGLSMIGLTGWRRRK